MASPFAVLSCPYFGGMDEARLVLALDLDGVVADYTEGLRRSIASTRGESPDNYTTEIDWSLSKWGLSPEEFSAAHRKAVIADQIFLTMPPIEGAVEGVTRLVDHGVRIRIITKRFVVEGDKARAATDTAVWLDLHKIPYHELCFVSDKSTCVADLYLDDAPHVITGLREAGLRVVAFEQPYNRDMGGERVRDWTEAVDVVLEAAREKWEAAGCEWGDSTLPKGDSPDPSRWGVAVDCRG